MPHPHIFHTTPSGSAFYKNPAIPYDPPFGSKFVNEWTQRDTSPGVYITNMADLSLSGPFRVQKVVVPSTEITIPSGGSFPYRRNIVITNTSADTVYFRHAAGVTTANGYPLPQNASISLDMLGFFPIWAISAGSSDIRILEIN
jgi:hypothetical protein